MVAVELQDESSAPGEAGDVRRTERDLSDQRRETASEVREAEVGWHVRGATRPRLVPSDHGELVLQARALGLPHPAIHRASVDEYERRPFADPLVGQLEPARPDDLHPGKGKRPTTPMRSSPDYP